MGATSTHAGGGPNSGLSAAAAGSARSAEAMAQTTKLRKRRTTGRTPRRPPGVAPTIRPRLKKETADRSAPPPSSSRRGRSFGLLLLGFLAQGRAEDVAQRGAAVGGAKLLDGFLLLCHLQ